MSGDGPWTTALEAALIPYLTPTAIAQVRSQVEASVGETRVWSATLGCYLPSLDFAKPVGHETTTPAEAVSPDLQPTATAPAGHDELLHDYRQTGWVITYECRGCGHGYSKVVTLTDAPSETASGLERQANVPSQPEHVLSGDCWCNPRIEHVEPGAT